MKTFKYLIALFCFSTAFAAIAACGQEPNDSQSSSTRVSSEFPFQQSSILQSESSFSSIIEDSSFVVNSSIEESSSSIMENSSSSEDSSFDSSSAEDSSSSTVEPVYNLDGAAAWLEDMYKTKTSGRKDYYLVKSLNFEDLPYAVTWTTNADLVTITELDDDYYIDVDESVLESVSYQLIATVKADNGEEKEVVFDCVLEGIKQHSTAEEIDLKELRTNIDSYVGKRVAFEGTVAAYWSRGVYVEDYDEESNRYFGMYCYYGFSLSSYGVEVLSIGNRVRIVGLFSYVEIFGYEVVDLEYDIFEPYKPNNILKLGEGYEAAYQEVSLEKFYSQVEIDGEAYTWADLAMETTVSLKNLEVVSIYTTNNDGDNDGALSITCNAEGKTIVIRIPPLRDSDDNLLFHQNDFLGKTIDVKGVVTLYIDYHNNSEYQIKVFSAENIVIHGAENV